MAETDEVLDLAEVQTDPVYWVKVATIICGFMAAAACLFGLVGVLVFRVPSTSITTWSESMVRTFVVTVTGTGILAIQLTNFYRNTIGDTDG